MPDEPGWYPDPKNEAPFRFFDGRKWTKSVADQQPGGERVDDGPVEGGLMGLLEHQPVNQPLPETERPATSGYVPLDQHIPLRAPSWGPMPEGPPEGETPVDPNWAPPPPPPPAPPAPAVDEQPPPPPPPPPPQAPPPPPPPPPPQARPPA